MSIAAQAAYLLEDTGEYREVRVESARTVSVMTASGFVYHVACYRERDGYARRKPSPCVYVTNDGQALYRYGI